MPCYDPIGPAFKDYYTEQGREASRILCYLIKYHLIKEADMFEGMFDRLVSWSDEHEFFDSLTEGQKVKYLVDRMDRKK